MAAKDDASVDASRGYERIAEGFLSARSGVGAAVARDWASSLPRGATVLDLGCGGGEPVTAALMDAGASVWAIDASPRLVAAFRERFPHVPVACEDALLSDFFGRTFDAVVAVGLVFLLPPKDQRRLFKRVSSALRPGGRFLFTAPPVPHVWRDVLTGGESISLGGAEYRAALQDSDMLVVAEFEDEGENHYYDAVKE